MKKIAYIFFSLFILSLPLFSQSEIDALRFSRDDLHGTARAMSMGGAFGALGGDLTGVSVNPAGIAVYRSSEVVATVNLTGEKSTAGSETARKTHFNMDNLGFVGYFPLRNDVIPLINFGFSYNKQKSFDKNVSAIGNRTPGNTLIDYMANVSAGIDPADLEMGDGLSDPFLNQPWLSALGYNAYLINPIKRGDTYYYDPVDTQGETARSQTRTNERGYVDNYDFTVGTTINNILNLGFSLSVKDIFYDLASDYQETFNDGGYIMSNELSVSGAGVGAKFGAIYRPVNSLRIGLAWHTPTWYALTEIYEAEISDDMGAYVKEEYEPGNINSGSYRNSYDLKTPGKIVASVATVFGSSFIVSVDYELVDYSKMKLKRPSNSMNDLMTGYYDGDNEIIAMDHKPASTVKAGMEYRFTPQFSGRLGYAWMQNPYEANLVKLGDAAIAGSNTIYRMEGDTHYFTGGLGYRFNRNFYLDLAVVCKTQTDDLYSFPNYYADDELEVDAAPFSLKNKSIRGLITLGYKF